ncbi:MAG TPA: glycoside hydrolase family 3 N-terminal domain-containing protein [Puia sp.]|nr:glycoside hydrolase family 3 N-terminal domain-containing protein [Puia sp.]
MKKFFLTIGLVGSAYFFAISQNNSWQDPNLPLDARVKNLVSQLTLEEKVQQMMYNAPAIPRLNIPAYNWWNEALHGVARSGVATIFPQAIGMAATFDDTLIYNIASAISDEARAMYNASVKKGYHLWYSGLTFWTPNINIFRDPRWGRGQETYGEDPYLTATLGVAFVKGMQGNDPKYLKVAACAKHFAVHSGPEKLRHEFNAQPSMKDLWETYLPAFHALVDAKVEAVMCAYNRTNNEPCCGNTYLLQDVLRRQWQFKGHVVSDCWAISDFYQGHKFVANDVQASALALSKGVNLNCGNSFYPSLIEAVKQNLVTEKQIDSSLQILLRTRFKLGLFDAVTGNSPNPYDHIPESVINSEANRNLARTAAQKSIVLLKNNGVLPLKNDLKTYFVTGPNASNIDVLIGNYYGVNNNLVTVLEGLAEQILPGSQMHYRQGILLDRNNVTPNDWSSGEARTSDATIVVMGISGLLEGEEGESIASPYAGDRLDYNLPANQIEYLRRLKENNNKPVIAVITGGSPMNLSEVHKLADAVLLVWYPGEEGGNAVADIIFGKVSPSGRLPITFPKSFDQLPPYEDYSMKGRTYRYMTAEPMYPFGYGLSYTRFSYSNLRLSKNVIKKNESAMASVTVTNTGKSAADEVIQLYISYEGRNVEAPLYALKSFKRITLAPGSAETVQFNISPSMLQLVNQEGQNIHPAGKYKISISGSLPGKRSEELGAAKAVEGEITVQ